MPDIMPSRTETIRARAHEHQQELESLRWFTPQRLSARWDVAETTVRDIPFEELPYREFGKGEKRKRRRYRPADVEAFEARTDRIPRATEGAA